MKKRGTQERKKGGGKGEVATASDGGIMNWKDHTDAHDRRGKR